MLAGRYLRTRRREGFVSVIAGFSFLGIMLGVATLIVVLSVMNGFRKELLEKIVGINGHIFVAPIDRPLTDYAEVADRISKVAGVRRAIPLIEGQAFASSQHHGSGLLVRGVRGADIARIEALWREARAASGGSPFLFGGRFGLADAMYAPVVARFLTWRPALATDTQAYVAAVGAHPLMERWYTEALAEPAEWLLDKHENPPS